jgi:hypothetical protein
LLCIREILTFARAGEVVPQIAVIFLGERLLWGRFLLLAFVVVIIVPG